MSCSNLSVDGILVKDINYDITKNSIYDLSSGNFIEIYSSNNIIIRNLMLANCSFEGINFLYLDIFWYDYR
jgi:hypothetical protein